MPQTFVLPRQVGLIGGAVAPASVLRFYQTGTSTPQNVYTDAALTAAVTSVTADSAGVFAKVYLNPNASANYRVTLENSSGVVSYTEDDISRFPASQADIGAALYPRTSAESSASVTPTNYAYPPGHVYRYGTNTTPGTTDMTTAIQNAINANFEVIFPDEECAFTSLTWKVRRVLIGKGPRKSVLRQLSSMNASATPAITFETGTPPSGGVSGDIAEGTYRMIGMGFVIASQTGFYCDNDSQASMWLSDQCRIESRQAASNSSLPYSVIAGQRAIYFVAGGVTSAFFGTHRNLEIRAFETGIECTGGVNEWNIHGWFLDCKYGVALDGCSTWNLSGLTVESGVQNARALKCTGAVSNITWNGGRWELTQTGCYGVEGVTSTGSNWWFRGINVLITSDGSAIPGRKWTGTLPDKFVFDGVDTVGPFIYIPNQISMRLPNLLLVGGSSLGNGKITIGRNAGGAEGYVEHDGTDLKITGGNGIKFKVGGTLDGFKTDDTVTAGQTRLLVYDVDNGQLERVTVGAADSGGAGYKVLRIPN